MSDFFQGPSFNFGVYSPDTPAPAPAPAQQSASGQDISLFKTVDTGTDVFSVTDITGDISSKPIGPKGAEVGSKEVTSDNQLGLDDVLASCYGNAQLTEGERYEAAKGLVRQNEGVQEAVNQYLSNQGLGVYDFSDPNFNYDTIPIEHIEGADFSQVESFNYEGLATFREGYEKGADGKISTNITFEPNSKDITTDPDTGRKTLDVSGCESNDDYQGAVLNAYGIEHLNSEAASAVLEGIVNDNPEKFQGLNIAGASNQDVINYMAEHNLTSLDVPDISLSSTDKSKTKNDYMKPDTETRSVQLHVTDNYVQTGVDVKKGADLLQFVEYGNGTLGDALKKNREPLYNGLNGQFSGTMTAKGIEELAATAILQIAENNEALRTYIQDNNINTTSKLLGLDLQKALGEDASILLEDVNYTLHRAKKMQITNNTYTGNTEDTHEDVVCPKVPITTDPDPTTLPTTSIQTTDTQTTDTQTQTTTYNVGGAEYETFSRLRRNESRG